MITLFNLDKYSHASIVRFVANALQRQGKRAEFRGRCKYLTEDGAKCAVGHLIPSEDYDPKFESQTVLTILRILGLEIPLVTVKLLQDMQHIHDHIQIQAWEDAFKRLEANAIAGNTMSEEWWAKNTHTKADSYVFSI